MKWIFTVLKKIKFLKHLLLNLCSEKRERSDGRQRYSSTCWSVNDRPSPHYAGHSSNAGLLLSCSRFLIPQHCVEQSKNLFCCGCHFVIFFLNSRVTSSRQLRTCRERVRRSGTMAMQTKNDSDRTVLKRQVEIKFHQHYCSIALY